MKLFSLPLLVAALAALVTIAPAGAQDALDSAPEVRTDIPETPAGALLEWFVEQVMDPQAEEIEEKLGETLNDVPAPEASRLAADMRTLRKDTDGFDVIRVLEVDALELDALLRARDGRSWWIVTVGARPEPPHGLAALKMSSLVAEPTEGLEDWRGLTWSLNQRDTPVMSLLVERVRDGRSPTISALHEDRRGAIAQTARLFVITLLAEEIAAGRVELDQGVTLDPTLRSLASEELDEIVRGEVYQVRELLSLAARGDNAAADQLLGFLGRGAVERLAAEVQGAESPNLPFLTSGEFFKLKLLPAGDELYRRYAGAESEDERRAVLTELVNRPLPTYEEADAIKRPTRVAEVEWDASAEELASLLGRLGEAMAAEPTGELREILNEVSPLNRKMGVWPFVFRVTGGEPGVYSEAFMVERLDGARFRFALVVENPSDEIDFRFYSRVPQMIMTLLALEELEGADQ